jgi:hypothetical protein
MWRPVGSSWEFEGKRRKFEGRNNNSILLFSFVARPFSSRRLAKSR